MILIKPSVCYLAGTNLPLELIEQAGRTCYKSEDKITPESNQNFVKKLLERGHEAVIEHASMTYRVVCDRGVTHEIVRHRLFSYCQESTRYCNYSGGVTFIIPPWCGCIEEGEYSKDNYGSYHCSDKLQEEDVWFVLMNKAESSYKVLINAGWSPQQARSVLPNSLKTEIVMTANLREWRHFFKMRTSKSAHPQMREVAFMILKDAVQRVPILFDEYLANEC
jgi:thymidylate synthase (FAD)